MKIIFNSGNDVDEDLLQRALLSYEHDENAWIYDIINDAGDDTNEVSTTVSVRFPRIDYDFVVYGLKTYIEKRDLGLIDIS